MSLFEPFPKLSRLKRGCMITEKLDGTNAQVYIVDPENLENAEWEETQNVEPTAIVDGRYVYAGSRTRLIVPGKKTDNFGFASWVKDNAEQIIRLGEGRHFGEWYGQGIQRAYGLTERRFALFNAHRWAASEFETTPEGKKKAQPPACCSVVPTLYLGPFDTNVIDAAMSSLKTAGSQAVPGFMDPEGVVVFHDASRTSYKLTYDDRHKEAA